MQMRSESCCVPISGSEASIYILPNQLRSHVFTVNTLSSFNYFLYCY